MPDNQVKEGQILPGMLVKQSNNNPKDGITFKDRFVIIVKDVNIGDREKKILNIKINKVYSSYAFATII